MNVYLSVCVCVCFYCVYAFVWVNIYVVSVTSICNLLIVCQRVLIFHFDFICNFASSFWFICNAVRSINSIDHSVIWAITWCFNNQNSTDFFFYFFCFTYHGYSYSSNFHTNIWFFVSRPFVYFFFVLLLTTRNIRMIYWFPLISQKWTERK